jgi:hypothetical protein
MPDSRKVLMTVLRKAKKTKSILTQAWITAIARNRMTFLGTTSMIVM